MSEDTPLQGVRVDSQIKESRVECKDCGASFTRHEFKDKCPKCSSLNLRLNRCTDFIVKSIEAQEVTNDSDKS